MSLLDKGYLKLPKKEKREMEERVLRNPYNLSIDEMRTLYEADFPFQYFDRQWLGSYLKLVDFYQVYHHSALRKPLSTWTQAQRSKRLKGKLLLGRERALNRIGFIWDIEAAQWETRFNAYKTCIQSKGKIAPQLLQWASMVRQRWNSLPESRKCALEAIQFDPNPHETVWKRNTEELEQIHAAQGHLIGLNVRLKQFVGRMRKLRRSNRLTPEQEDRLERVGICWSTRPSSLRAPYSSVWEMRYDEVRIYAQTNPQFPPVYKWPNKPLSCWVRKQWLRWSSLSPSKQARLSLLQLEPGEVRRIELRTQWDKQYATAQELYQQLGKYHIATYERVNKTTARWIRRQFEIWNTLQSDQKEKIMALGISLLPGQAKPLKWENGFQRALRYTEQGLSFGNTASRSLLRLWIRRQVKRMLRLTADQQQKLLQITSRLTHDYFPLPPSPNDPTVGHTNDGG